MREGGERGGWMRWQRGACLRGAEPDIAAPVRAGGGGRIVRARAPRLSKRPAQGGRNQVAFLVGRAYMQRREEEGDRRGAHRVSRCARCRRRARTARSPIVAGEVTGEGGGWKVGGLARGDGRARAPKRRGRQRAQARRRGECTPPTTPRDQLCAHERFPRRVFPSWSGRRFEVVGARSRALDEPSSPARSHAGWAPLSLVVPRAAERCPVHRIRTF